MAALERQAATLTTQFENNQTQIDVLATDLRQRQGAFGELFGAARQAAGEFAAIINASLVSAQFPGRADALESLATGRTLPTARNWTTSGAGRSMK